MPFNLLLLPLIGGFVLLSHWNFTLYFAKRLDKERLLLYSSLVGAILLGVSFATSIVIASSPDWTACYYLLKLRKWWAFNTPAFDYSGVSAFALMLGVLGPPVLNHLWPIKKLWTKEKQGAKAVRDFGSPLEQLLLKALKEEKNVMVTLTNGKVYIGRVATSLAPEDETSFSLLPNKSGYREGEKQRLELTTHYDVAYKRILEGETDGEDVIADFGVVIPVKDVVSATLFRGDIYTKYFPHASKLIDP
ncbi:hypothetical protein [Persicitalea sp.]|uniref:hypothetical protein n=1 Tax=Persicitalea sp. TaxID=3100273 RepID=UPI0035939516